MFHNKKVSTNGKMIADETAKTITITFATEDPSITLDISDIVRSTGNKMKFRLQMVRIPNTMAKELERELKRKIRL